jgi:sporulation protein YlmC with PRC-barrel domain
VQAGSDKLLKLQTNPSIGVFLISFETIVDKQVIGTGGFIIGEVKGALIDTQTWQIPQLYVKLSDNAANELGFKKRFRSSTVCLPTKMVQAVGDVVTIAPPLKALSESNEITEYKP